MALQKFLICSIVLLEISFGLAPNVALAIPTNSSTENPIVPPKPEVKTDNKGTLSQDNPASSPAQENTFVIKSKHPDPNYGNSSMAKSVTEMKKQEAAGTSDFPDGAQPEFDDYAVKRALLVISVLAAILLIYFGIKFVYMKKRKLNKRYGRIDAEIDLLDEIEDGDTEEEDDTLFDINSTRRSQF